MAGALPAHRRLRVRTRSWFGWLWGLLLLVPALAPAAAETLPGPLVGVAWLQQQLSRPDLLVLDASPAAMHKARHIPGAVGVDLFAYGPHEPSRAEMERRMRSWGVSAGRRIVIVDPGGTYLATRLFYDLLHHGFPERSLAVLDGGMARWTAAGGMVTQEPTPPPPAGDWRITHVDESVRVRLPEFLHATGDPRQHVVEALDPAWYFGQTAWFDRAGHVPNAVMWPSGDFFNADKTFKSAAEIRLMMDHLGIRADQPVHTYCGGGIAASVPFFALRHIAGHAQVKLFPESQLGWLQDARGLPMWTYAAPQLLRDTAWLKTWGGKVMAGYGLASATIVDLRGAEAYRQLRLPLSVNVPADEVRRLLGQPEALAQLFAQAGVDPAKEAVVMADAGLDPQAALGFVALQSLGQARVSVYADGIDHWAATGHEVQRGAAAAPAAAVAASARRGPPRDGVLVGAMPPAAGPYPRVYLASGRVAPAQPPTGTVVQLPYTELVDRDGRPKPAKDIWKALAKAGVPRYAELVAFADDPGEAAVNVVLLRLMGLRDVRLWLR